MSTSLPRQRSVALGVERFATRTATLPPATETNSYALGELDVLLVEPAPTDDAERSEWLAWARGLVSQGRRLVGILATHHHADHVGGAQHLAGALGTPLFAHARTLERIDSIPGARVVADGEAFVLQGPTPQRWQVLHTPGHAPGHVCLHEPSLGIVVVGDMVASVGTILIDPTDGDMTAYLQQLRRLEAQSARVALPAHGDPIDNPSELFARYVAHRLAREATVLRALTAAGAAGASPIDLVPTAYADVAPSAWPLARLSIEAHLVKLETDGYVRRTSDGRFVAHSENEART